MGTFFLTEKLPFEGLHQSAIFYYNGVEYAFPINLCADFVYMKAIDYIIDPFCLLLLGFSDT